MAPAGSIGLLDVLERQWYRTDALVIATDGTGYAYVSGYTTSSDFPTHLPYQSTLKGGEDLFVTKVAPAGNALAYSTFLGGSLDEEA